jgi:hypothetical protein
MCDPDKPDRIWQAMKNPFEALSGGSSEEEGVEASIHPTSFAVWAAAYQASAVAAASCQGGSVYTQQNVKGLSDADPTAPLSVAFVSCTSTEVQVGSHGARSSTPPRFLVQSGFKPLVYAMALAHDMHVDLKRIADDVLDVGFASSSLSEDGK